MNKLVEILEQHCQWIAIGIGGLFLVWVLWAYVLVNPAEAEVGGKVYSPANVDDEVRRSGVDSLKQRIAETSTEAPPAKLANPSEPWLVLIKGDDRKVPQLPSYAFSSIPRRDDISRVEDKKDERELVQDFPKLVPAETLSDESSLKAAKATVVPFPALVAGVQPPPQPAPQPGVLPVNAFDITYIRGDFRISTQEMAKAFQDARIPPTAFTTSIAAIKVLRQEVLPNGKFGPTEVVQVIPNSVQLMPAPDKNATFQSMQVFKAWTEQQTSQTSLLQPPFFTVAVGEGPWDAPQKIEIIDPEAERKAKLAAAAEAAAAERAARQPAQPRPRREGAAPRQPARRGAAADEGYLNQDSSRPSSLNDLAGLQLAQARPGMFGNPESEMGSEPAGITPGQPAQPGVGGLPPAAFNPSQAPNIFGWYFDTKVTEGHAYRYQVLYGIINPIWNSNLADPKKPNLIQQLVIWSEESPDAWTAPVHIDSSTRYYLANSSWQPTSVPGTVSVEIFKWAAGKWQSRTFKVAPGDRVTGTDGKTNFDTNNVVVDIRYDDRLERAYVIFLQPDGTLLEREPIADRNDPTRTGLQRAVQGVVTPTAGTGEEEMGSEPPPAGPRPGVRRAGVPDTGL